MEKQSEYRSYLNSPNQNNFVSEQNKNVETGSNNHEKLMEELYQLSNDITLEQESYEKFNPEPTVSGFKLKEPPDISEILALDEEEIPATSFNVGIINSACQNVLRDMEQQLMYMLKKNRKEQELVQNYLNSNDKNLNSEIEKKPLIKCAGMPYFKDLDGYPPPLNEDVLSKKIRDKILPVDFIDESQVWNSIEANKLIEAVSKSLKSPPTSDQPIDYNSIDWMKISTIDMGGKFSPTECKSKWILNLRPDINKGKWCHKEVKSLEKVAKEHNHQDWDKIAQVLGTNRTGFQCCVKFYSSRVLNSGKWTKEEDDLLVKTIEKYRVKDYIPWKKVTWHFEKRSLRQCEERYYYCLRNIRKGHFSIEEDFMLVKLANQLKNFGEVAKHLPRRVSGQIRARYDYLVKVSMPNFTKEEDELLSNLMIKYPRNWEKISEHFKNRSITQCRSRWAEIQKDIVIDSNERNEIEESEEVAGNSRKTRKKENSRNDVLSIGKKLLSMSKLTLKSTEKKYSEKYSEVLEYFSHCHKFLFGPKARMPNNPEEVNKMCKYFKTISKILSVNNLNLLNSYDINSLRSNCEFEEEDILLLNTVKETINENEEQTQSYMKIIPPNFTTLVGIRSILLSWSKISRLSKFYEPSPETISVSRKSVDRPLFRDAKKLFRDRMRSLFALPIMFSNISQEGMEIPSLSKPKIRKATKKLSKLKRKEHAKFMNRAYKSKMKKILEKNFSEFGRDVLGETENAQKQSQVNNEGTKKIINNEESSKEIYGKKPGKRKVRAESETEGRVVNDESKKRRMQIFSD